MIAEKENKLYNIDNSMMDFYKNQGFDIKNDDGEIIEYGAGKTVALEDFAKLQAENAALKAELAALKETPKKRAAKKEVADDKEGE